MPTMSARFIPEITPRMLDGLPQNGPTDPIEYYKRPLVGRLFRERINMGLRLLGTEPLGRVLEVGYGAGAVLLAMAPFAREMAGIDLDADPTPVTRMLSTRDVRAELRKGSVYELPYADASFDVVVCFSVFEHLHEFGKGLAEVQRVLAPNGRFLLGMPAVNRVMEVGFRAIGFKGIEDHHVTTPQAVSRAFVSAGFAIEKRKYLGLQVDHLALYYTWLLRKRA
jgi:SAM-dependent methyltransferase